MSAVRCSVETIMDSDSQFRSDLSISPVPGVGPGTGGIHVIYTLHRDSASTIFLAFENSRIGNEVLLSSLYFRDAKMPSFQDRLVLSLRIMSAQCEATTNNEHVIVIVYL